MCPQAIITYLSCANVTFCMRQAGYRTAVRVHINIKKYFLENLHQLIYSSDVKVPVSTYYLWYGVCYVV